MNERIKELVVESGNGQMRDGRLYPHIGIRFEEDWQRFAELLIRECMALCKTSVGNADYNTGRLHCLENIKEHFGME